MGCCLGKMGGRHPGGWQGHQSSVQGVGARQSRPGAAPPPSAPDTSGWLPSTGSHDLFLPSIRKGTQFYTGSPESTSPT